MLSARRRHLGAVAADPPLPEENAGTVAQMDLGRRFEKWSVLAVKLLLFILMLVTFAKIIAADVMPLLTSARAALI